MPSRTSFAPVVSEVGVDRSSHGASSSPQRGLLSTNAGQALGSEIVARHAESALVVFEHEYLAIARVNAVAGLAPNHRDPEADVRIPGVNRLKAEPPRAQAKRIQHSNTSTSREYTPAQPTPLAGIGRELLT